MRSLTRSRVRRAHVAALIAAALIIGSATTVAAKPKPTQPPPPPPPQPNPTVTISIAPTGTLEPSGEYANVDITVTCPVGWTFSSGSLYLLRPDRAGGAGSFAGACTGAPGTAAARVVNGNRFTLADWNATAYVRVTKSGQQVQFSSTRTVTLQPGVLAQIAPQGQLTGSAGGGVSLAITAACPIGATGQPSTLTVTQGSATGQATFTPTCDRFGHTHVLSIAASQGTFHTGSADANASVRVGSNGATFSGSDSRTVTILESSTGDATPPSTPANLNANVFGDGETWLDWGASTDNATPSGLIVYEVFLNGQFDQGICCGMTRAILYAEVGVLNTIEVVAVDGAGNRSAPASVQVDLR
ncbi:MAG TPA: hypothetical protein VFV72_01065 [Candidatus Limnocylindrales bacterium]|nr:hypothetical protein [Candidatus Limnocylindrales bacterium]